MWTKLTYFSDALLCKLWGVHLLKRNNKKSIIDYLWLLPFSNESSSSSLFNRSRLFMKGNFLLKLIFCFPCCLFNVPVDLESKCLQFQLSNSWHVNCKPVLQSLKEFQVWLSKDECKMGSTRQTWVCNK